MNGRSAHPAPRWADLFRRKVLMKNSFAFCERCNAKLAEIRNGEYNIVWLELDQRTGTYTNQEVPTEFSQGGFPFGKDCAKIMLAEHEAAQPALALDASQAGYQLDNTGASRQ